MQIPNDGNPPLRRSILGGLVLALVLAVVGCTSLNRYAAPPRISLAGIRILDLSLFEQRYRFALRVQNPNPVELPIVGMSYALDVNGTEFARGVSNQTVTIPAFGEQVLHISVVANVLNTFEQLQHWGQWPPRKLDYQLKGKIQVANIPISLPFEYSGKISLHE